MADPVVIECPQEVWTKVATNVMTGIVHVKEGINLNWFQTYRNTGNPAPTNLEDAVNLIKPMELISNTIGIDIYVYPMRGDGTVRVDL